MSDLQRDMEGRGKVRAASMHISEEMRIRGVDETDLSYVYLAAPFFSFEERERMAEIEGIFDQAGCRYFSPRLADKPEDQTGGLKNPAVRATINRLNKKMIDTADVVVAWIDRLLPPGVEIMMVQGALVYQVAEGIDEQDTSGRRPETWQQITSGKVLKKGLVKPDDGTLWEMGYAVGKDVPVVAMTFREPDTINLMLSENLDGAITSMEELDFFANCFAMSPPGAGLKAAKRNLDKLAKGYT